MDRAECTFAEQPPAESSINAARAAGLRYVRDNCPGIRRRRAGKGFVYVDPHRRKIDDWDTLTRIRALAIPPAWEKVWICPDQNGHLQATGIDSRGRKQYRYHPRWRQTRDQTKYDKMIAFAKALPRIRQRVGRDLARSGMSREKVLAAVVRLLEMTLIRVGNEEYARDNDSYGLTTIHNHHVDVNGSRIRFKFRGKSGKVHEIGLEDPRLAKIIRRCQDLPGQELFAYVDDDGQVCDVTSADVNEYLQEIAGEEFTAKDFRTWAGTVLAAMALQSIEPFRSQRQAKRNVVRAIEAVAMKLGNTPAVCRKCYVHPAILNSYMDGSLMRNLQRKVHAHLHSNGSRLPQNEATVLRFLENRLERNAA